MATSGPNTAGTGANDAAAGVVAWSNPTRITASDNSRSQAARASSSSTTQYLKGTNFGFAIPTGATIVGILVEIERFQSAGGGTMVDLEVKIVKADGTFGTTNKASGTNWTGTEAFFSYGGASDLWGETWTSADINDADFGVVLRGTMTMGAETNVTADVDSMRITITYSEGGGQVYSTLPCLGAG